MCRETACIFNERISRGVAGDGKQKSSTEGQVSRGHAFEKRPWSELDAGSTALR